MKKHNSNPLFCVFNHLQSSLQLEHQALKLLMYMLLLLRFLLYFLNLHSLSTRNNLKNGQLLLRHSLILQLIITKKSMIHYHVSLLNYPTLTNRVPSFYLHLLLQFNFITLLTSFNEFVVSKYVPFFFVISENTIVLKGLTSLKNMDRSIGLNILRNFLLSMNRFDVNPKA